jgi:inner membrane protein involved in colicin E2 resistance
MPTPIALCPNPNCGYRGPVKKKAKGSFAVFLLLLVLSAVFFVLFPLAGLALVIAAGLYFVLNFGHKRVCPRCNNAIPT